jgi:hypothetical protein
VVYPNHGLPVWFGSGQSQDARYLQAWRKAPFTYSAADVTGASWSADRYEVILGYDKEGELFNRAAELALSNRFYPPEVMSIVSDYSLEGRSVRPGDRVLQRIPILTYNRLPLVELLTLNEISEVIQEPRQVGFTCVTTAVHSEVGEWTARVEWRGNGEVALVIEVVSRSRFGNLPFFQQRTRQLQLRAHKLSIEHFLAQLKGEPPAAPQPFAWALPRLAPVALAAIPILLLFSARSSKR